MLNYYDAEDLIKFEEDGDLEAWETGLMMGFLAA